MSHHRLASAVWVALSLIGLVAIAGLIVGGIGLGQSSSSSSSASTSSTASTDSVKFASPNTNLNAKFTSPNTNTNTNTNVNTNVNSGGRIGTAAKPTAPPTGAASLALETCGCPSTMTGSPVCANQRTWGVAKQWDSALGGFQINITSAQRQVLEGSYLLTVANSGVPNTTLESIYVGLERPVSRGGNVPGPSGSNWMRVAQVMVSQAAACNAANEAYICSNGASYLATGSPGSTLVVLDGTGNSIVGLGTVVIPTTSQDCDADGNILDGGYDGASCPHTGNLTVDDDGDGRVDEDGYCCNVLRFVLRYRFDLTALGLDPAQLANQPMRLDVLATFLAGGPRGGTCATDTNCDGRFSTAEQQARTVQTRTSIQFPTVCVDQCQTVRLTEDPLLVSYLGSELPAQPLNVTAVPPTYNAVYSMTGNSNTTLIDSLFQLVQTQCQPGDACYPYDSPYRITDVVHLSGTETSPCVDTFGNSLIVPASATAYEDVTCPAVPCPPTPTASTSTPSPSAPPPGPHPPPTGLLCTYTGGIFQSNQQCNPADLAPYTNVCAERRLGVKPACLVDNCFLAPFLRMGVNVAGNKLVTLQNSTALGMGNLMRQFATDNTGTPYYFTQTLVFTAVGAPGSLSTSAQNFARQDMTTFFNRYLTVIYDNATVIAAYNALYYGNDTACTATVGSSIAGLRISDLFSFSNCAVGLPYFTANVTWPTNVSTPASIQTFCALHCAGSVSYALDDACVRFVSLYLQSNGFSYGGKTIWSALTDALALYNVEFDECGAPATQCLWLPAAA